jgi:hypothetical protein
VDTHILALGGYPGASWPPTEEAGHKNEMFTR